MRASAKLPIGISGRDGSSVLWTTLYHICEVNMACLVRMALLMLGFVNAKTEEFLNLFLWSAEQLMRPTFRNLTDSYEAWAYRHGLLKQIHRLERKHWIERSWSAPSDRGACLFWEDVIQSSVGNGIGTDNGGSCYLTCLCKEIRNGGDCGVICVTKGSGTSRTACGLRRTHCKTKARFCVAEKSTSNR